MQLISKLLNIFRHEDRRVARLRIIYAIILLFSLLALLASFQLSIDKLLLLKNPNEQLSCNINLVLNCASVMKTPQSELFGFPNSFIGLIGYGAIVFFAFAGLLNTRYSKAALRVVFTGTFAALLFALWLFLDSIYVIQILCPWCLLMAASTVIVMAALTRLALIEEVLHFTKSMKRQSKLILKQDYDRLFFASLLVVMVLLVVVKFGDSLLG